MDIPKVPVLFMKPQTALADPWPAPTVLPKQTIEHDDGDYESELAVVIGKNCKNVSEADALDYVLGYTASNDVSSRTAQFAQSQWCFSKGFDGSCPIGKYSHHLHTLLTVSAHWMLLTLYFYQVLLSFLQD